MQVTQLEASASQVLVGAGDKAQSFSVSSDASFMGLLSTSLYSNPMLAALREVMFNAWDAHKKVGKTKVPIHITVSNQEISIRDFGPGIIKSDMHEIYCVYGSSTKRFDPDQTGGFGLGSKAPFAYTESFTVISENAGVKTVYLISRNQEGLEGQPGMTEITSVSTTNTGLTVRIPLKKQEFGSDKHDVLDTIKSLLVFSGIFAKINGIDQPVFDIDNLRNTGHQIVTGVGRSPYCILLSYGGVLYPVPIDQNDYDRAADEIHLLMNKIDSNLIIYVKPGSIAITPNREQVNMTEKTYKVIQKSLNVWLAAFSENIDIERPKLYRALCQAVKTDPIPNLTPRKMVEDLSYGVIDRIFPEKGRGIQYVIWHRLFSDKTNYKIRTSQDKRDASLSFLGSDVSENLRLFFQEFANAFPTQAAPCKACIGYTHGKHFSPGGDIWWQLSEVWNSKVMRELHKFVVKNKEKIMFLSTGGHPKRLVHDKPLGLSMIQADCIAIYGSIYAARKGFAKTHRDYCPYVIVGRRNGREEEAAKQAETLGFTVERGEYSSPKRREATKFEFPGHPTLATNSFRALRFDEPRVEPNPTGVYYFIKSMDRYSPGFIHQNITDILDRLYPGMVIVGNKTTYKKMLDAGIPSAIDILKDLTHSMLNHKRDTPALLRYVGILNREGKLAELLNFHKPLRSMLKLRQEPTKEFLLKVDLLILLSHRTYTNPSQQIKLLKLLEKQELDWELNPPFFSRVGLDLRSVIHTIFEEEKARMVVDRVEFPQHRRIARLNDAIKTRDWAIKQTMLFLKGPKL